MYKNKKVSSVIMLLIYASHMYGQNIVYFHSIGNDIPKTTDRKKTLETHVMDIEEHIDEGNVYNPSLDDIKVCMPTVALPLKQITVTSPFGIRRDPCDKSKHRFHSGIDLRAHYENVYSMLPGIVVAADYSKTGGNYITIDHGVCSCSYLHLSKIKVGVGQYVRAGQFIGVSGNTGTRTTGEHLHISCRLNSPEHKYFNPILILGFISDQLLYYQQIKQ